MARSRSILVGVMGGVATFAAYMVGAGRAFGYDAAVTVHNFVLTDSIVTALTRQVVFNNHPFTTATSWLVAHGSGSTDEALLRVLPILAASVAVGLVGWFASDRWSWRAGTAAMLVVATNPMVAQLSRDVRGYSVLLLAAVASTILLDRDRPGPLYLVTIAVGLAAQMYMAFVIVLHVAHLFGTRRLTTSWRRALLGGSVLGSLSYLGLANAMLSASRGTLWRVTFPFALSREVLGGTALAVACFGGLCAVGSRGLRFHDLLSSRASFSC